MSWKGSPKFRCGTRRGPLPAQLQSLRPYMGATGDHYLGLGRYSLAGGGDNAVGSVEPYGGAKHVGIGGKNEGGGEIAKGRLCRWGSG